MANENIDRVILNSADVLDDSRRCNLLYIRPYKTVLFEEYNSYTFTAVDFYIAIAEYEDNGESLELLVGDDGFGSLLAFETEEEWVDYMELNFGKLMVLVSG